VEVRTLENGKEEVPIKGKEVKVRERGGGCHAERIVEGWRYTL
jgi:hypothetical protein